MKVETPFGTLADDTLPFEGERVLVETAPCGCKAFSDDTGVPCVLHDPNGLMFHIAFDLGGCRFSTKRATLAQARECIASMDAPQGYSSHSATIYEWRARAVDGKPYLHTIERYWFGELVDPSTAARAPLSPLLDSDDPDYDPDLYVAQVDA